LKREGALNPNALMAACRASGKGGGWEAEAIEQLRWLLANGEGKERLLAWVKLHSVARGWPWCVDESGRALRIASAASDLGWAVSTVERYAATLVAEGRARLKKSQLGYRADVPEAMPETDDPATLYNHLFPGYLTGFISGLPEKQQKVIRGQQTAFNVWKADVVAEAVAVARDYVSRVERTMVRSWGASKIVLPKRRPAESRWLQLSLLAEPEFVQSPSTEASSDPLYEAIPRSVQSAPSLLPFRTDQTEERKPPPPPTEDDGSALAAFLSSLNCDEQAAKTLLSKCRAVNPGVTVREVCGLASFRNLKGSRNPLGVLLMGLPTDCVETGGPLARVRETIRRTDERAAAAAGAGGGDGG
jgi:hypothetical protein